MKKLSDAELVAREYATIDKLGMRRLDRTGWLRGDDEPWAVALGAIAEARPTRILEVGSGAGDFAVLLTAPEVVCVDLSPAAVEAARTKGLAAQVADAQQVAVPRCVVRCGRRKLDALPRARPCPSDRRNGKSAQADTSYGRRLVCPKTLMTSTP
jgi:SAM-dependent methyltransferase